MNQHASEELAATLRAAENGQPLPPLTDLPEAEGHLGVELVMLAATITPAPDFAEALATRLRDHAAAGVRSRERIAPSISTRHTVFQRGVWAALLVLALLGSLLLVPPVRAKIAEVLHLGAVTINVGSPPASKATPLTSPLQLTGQTTLADAQKRAGFTIRLPTYPDDLGAPYVFVQDLGGPAVVLVWTDPHDPQRVRLALQELSDNVFVEKSLPPTITTTTVNGQPAIWTDGPFLLDYRDSGLQRRRLVTGHGLIWAQDTITYVLETGQSLADAVHTAESLR